MKYLFFDIECANPRFNSICTFGYYLTQEDGTVIAHDDILMNPETSYDPYVIKNILHYTKEELAGYMPFPCYHDRLGELLQDTDTMVFGFSISNDIRFLNETCLRYRLPCLNFRFYDVQKIFGAYTQAKDQTGIEAAGETLNLEKPSFVHRSDEDARITMEIAFALCKEMELTLPELVSRFDVCGGWNRVFIETWDVSNGKPAINHKKNHEKNSALRRKKRKEKEAREALAQKKEKKDPDTETDVTYS